MYFALTSSYGLKVWILDKSCDEMKWVLKGQYDLKPLRAFNRLVHGPWVLQDINYEFFRCQLPEVNKKALGEEEFEWDSDNDNVVNSMDVVQEGRNLCNILGFHPFKEILFLSSFRGEERRATVHAYHLNSSRVECLGDMCPSHYDSFEPSCTQSAILHIFSVHALLDG